MSASGSEPAIQVRRLRWWDLERVIAIDARHRGMAVPEYWERVRATFLTRDRMRMRVALGAERGGQLVGFLLGEERAFEFGSEPCGWIFAVGVEPEVEHHGIASRLLDEACRRFQADGLTRVRTMVRRGDVRLLSFFRAHSFAAGEFTQLEVELPEAVEQTPDSASESA